jgi:hypothetical protein
MSFMGRPTSGRRSSSGGLLETVGERASDELAWPALLRSKCRDAGERHWVEVLLHPERI